MLSLDQLADFLQNTRWPRVPERQPTFFSIAGFPHYENVMSNVYQFFFSTDSPHNLGSLCVDALLDVVRQKSGNLLWPSHTFEHVYAQREVTTVAGRLDILIHNSTVENEWEQATAAILIENKVYHHLANNLNEYWQYFSSNSIDNRKVGVVMGLSAESLPINWVYITHLEWALAVESRLGFALYRAETRYTTLLLELIENIRHMSATENFQPLQFFQQNRTAIFQAEQVREEAFSLFPEALRRSLPNYEMRGSKAESRDGWLVIYRRGYNQFKYLLYYRELFYENKKPPTYRIQLLSASASIEEVKELQKALIEHSGHLFKDEEIQTPQVLIKTYELQQGNTKPLHEIIIESLRYDWQPLEQYWLK